MSTVASDQIRKTTHLEGDSSLALRIANAALGDGLAGGGASTLSVAVSDLAGFGMEDDGSNNLRIATSGVGAGLTGGGGSAIAIDYTASHDFSASGTVIVATPTADNHAATKGYVDGALEGLSWKDAVRVDAGASNITLSAPGATIDGVTMAQDDRVLVRNQTLDEDNGIYIFNGAASAMTRAEDADSSDELEMAAVMVEEGTEANKKYTQTSTNFVLDTGAVTWVKFSSSTDVSAGYAIDFAANVIDVSLDELTADTALDAGEHLIVSTAADARGTKITKTNFVAGIEGAGLTATNGVLSVNASGGLEVSGDDVVVASGLAGDGLALAAGVMSVNVTNGLEISSDTVGIAASAAGDGLAYSTGVLSVNLESSNPTLQISTDELGVKIDADGGLEAVADGLAVKLDGSTLSLSASGLKVADASIGADQLSWTSDVEDFLGSAFSLVSGSVYSVTLSNAPIVDAATNSFALIVARNGVDDQTRVAGAPAAAGEWRINGSDLEIFGAPVSIDTFRIRYIY